MPFVEQHAHVVILPVEYHASHRHVLLYRCQRSIIMTDNDQEIDHRFDNVGGQITFHNVVQVAIYHI